MVVNDSAIINSKKQLEFPGLRITITWARTGTSGFGSKTENRSQGCVGYFWILRIIKLGFYRRISNLTQATRDLHFLQHQGSAKYVIH